MSIFKKRVQKLLLILLPVIVFFPLIRQDPVDATEHQHPYIHDHIAAVPAAIQAFAEQQGKASSLDFSSSKGASGIDSVSAAPSSAPSDVGQWTQVYQWPLVAVHTALLPDQKVLMWDAWEFGASPSARLWDPATQTFTSVPNTTSGLFCAGQVMLPDGRQLVSGGHNGSAYGINHTNIFDWVSHTWSRVTNMNFDRWYPSTITLGDGRAFVFGGQADPNTYDHIPEVYDAAANTWTRLDNASRPVGNYPYIFQAPNGKVFNIVDDNGYSAYLDVASQTWTNIGLSPLFYFNAVMYQPGKIMMVGGANDLGKTTSVIDLNQGAPSWRTTAPMAYNRFLNNLVVLPDGNVLTVGGADNLSLVSTTGVLQAEMWNPNTETWSQLTPMQNLRMYHSTALLLPDGRVLVAGGGRLSPAVDYPTAEIYSPPYLFKGARPTITSAPTAAIYGQSITVQTPDAANISSVALVHLSSVTHAFNTDQRFIPASFTKNTGSLTVQIPANANVTTPGYYMLFILNSSGVPSVSKIIQIGGQSQPNPTATATLTRTPTPNVGVTGTLTPT
nr:DUF1929 domain-containing protein [Anaerolineae bacterium]